MGRPWHEVIAGSPRQYVRAFVQTLATTVSFAVAGGVFLLPAQFARLRIDPHLHVMACQNFADASMMVMLIHETPNEVEEPTRHRLVTHQFSTAQTSELMFERIRPTCFTIGPGRETLFVGDEDGAVHAINLSVTPRLGRILGRHIECCPAKLACSNDQRTLVSLGKQSGLYVWDLEDSSIRWCRIEDQATCAVILPHSQAMVCCTFEGQRSLLREYDLDTGRVLQLVSDDADRLTGLTVSPDGRRLAGVLETGYLKIWERAEPGERWESHRVAGLAEGQNFITPAFSPQSDLLAAGHPDGRRLVVWDLRRGRELREIGNLTEVIVGCEFLDQRLLVTWDFDGQVLVWDFKNDPSHPHRIPISTGGNKRR